MSILNLDDLDKIAIANSDALEKKRLAKVSSINKAKEARQREVIAQDAKRRVDEQARLKLEVMNDYLSTHLYASEKDFNQLWSSLPERERLIRENRAFNSRVPRM
jgi:hypothetical protein